MKVVNYTKARNNLRSLIDEAVDNEEEIIITTKDDKTVMMISLDRFNLTHARIKGDVEASFEEIELGKTHDIEDVFKDAKESYRKK